MNRHRKKITNPMTIIAIFAVLTEGSATVSLPFLDDDERDVYVWFLIGFPFCLIFLFFVTLNFNYKSLYAPSDFKKGKHFIKIIDNVAYPKKIKAHPSNTVLLKQHNYTACSGKDVHLTARLLKCSPQSFIFRQQKYRYSSRNGQAPPPAHINSFAHHALHLPQALHGLHIIDTRQVNTKKDVEILITAAGLKTSRKPGTRDLVIFITNQKFAQLINQSELKKLNKDKIKQSHYIVYNLNTQTLSLNLQA